MKIPFINLETQYKALHNEINRNIQNTLSHGQYILGPEIQKLEDKLSKFINSKYCISVGSGTDALMISLMSIGIKAGDEVITTPFTFVSTAEVIALLGAKPVFIDIDEQTCNINSSLIEEKITKKTKAIIPVSLYGQPADMDEINLIAKKYGLIVIEDGAQSFGSKYKEKFSCNLSDIGCTSFFPSKPFGCYGDGGAIFTNDKKLANIMKEIRVHGQSERYVHSRVGMGGRMDSIQASILLAKLPKLEWEINERSRIGSNYNKFFDELGIERVIQKTDRTSVYAQYTIKIRERDELVNFLQEKGIPIAIHYPVPLNQQTPYMKYCCPDCTPVSKDVSQRVLSLPMSPYLEKDHQKYIFDSFLEFYKN